MSGTLYLVGRVSTARRVVFDPAPLYELAAATRVFPCLPTLGQGEDPAVAELTGFC